MWNLLLNNNNDKNMQKSCLDLAYMLTDCYARNTVNYPKSYRKCELYICISFFFSCRYYNCMHLSQNIGLTCYFVGLDIFLFVVVSPKS